VRRIAAEVTSQNGLQELNDGYFASEIVLLACLHEHEGEAIKLPFSIKC